MELIIGISLLVGAVFLVIAVLMQQGKQKGLSGSISGGADTFFGKQKGKTVDKILSKATTIVAILFVALVITLYVIQPDSHLVQHGSLDIPDASVTTEEDHTGHDHDGDGIADDATEVSEEATEPATEESTDAAEEATEPAVEESTEATEEATEPAVEESAEATEEATEPAAEESTEVAPQ